MKKIIFLILNLCLFTGLRAQEKVLLKVVYHVDYRNYTDGERMKDLMCLDIGRSTSCFYSLNTLKAVLLRDSIIKNGGNFTDFVRLRKSKNLTDGQSYRVFKNVPLGKVTLTERVGQENLKTVEDKGSIIWNLISRDTLIAGPYGVLVCKCNLAICDFHGRKWKVWYAPDIACSDGPWKLHGLPGLILSAIDTSGNFSFSVAEIRKDGKSLIMQPSNKFKECTLKQMTSYRRKIIENPLNLLKSNIPPGVEMDFGDLEKKLHLKKNKAELIEFYDK